MDLDGKHLLNEDPNVTLTIRLIMQGKVSTPFELLSYLINARSQDLISIVGILYFFVLWGKKPYNRII